MQISSPAFVASVLLVVALLGTVVLASDTGPEPTGAVTITNQAEAERGTLARSVLTADDRSGDGVALPPITAAAALPEPTGGASPVTTPGAIPTAERAQCESGAAVGAGDSGLADDCAVLLAVKDTLRGTATTLNWGADTAIADWYGITVSGSPLRVTRLHLDGRNSRTSTGVLIVLTGTIPATLGSLPKLEHLTLSRHALTGTIPPALGKLAQLTNLSLYGNQLTGTIPLELGNLENLAALYLSTNQLTGGIPVELSNAESLLILSLENNQFTGSIPVELADLPELVVLRLYGNTMLTGCIPTGLPNVGLAGLTACTTTTTYALTTGSNGNGRVSPLPGTYSYLSGESVTVTATPDSGHRVASWGGDCSGTTLSCTLTMGADKTASVTFERITYTLTVTATGQGTVTPAGTTTQDDGDEVTLRASWSDATHDLDGWGGDCSGTASTCVLTMDGNKSVTAAFTALPGDRCAAPTDADCIRAIYLGAPGDYAQVTDIPASVLLTPEADGRYYVERGQQLTVVTSAPLPVDYTRFYLQRIPLASPSPVSFAQLIQPVGTTYTFTVTDDEAASTLITYDLTAARPHPVRPTHKPELGDVVVTTVFSVETATFRYDTFDTTGEVTAAGSYAFVSDTAATATAVTTYEALRDGTTTGLLIHQSDAHGASQVALYDAVEAGDLLEWHETDDCFVRYQVNEVMADPTGTPPRKLFAVEWTTYAFTGCSGAVPAGTVATVDWGELPDLGGTGLTAPVVHGIYQLVPAGWTGETEEFEVNWPPAGDPDSSYENPVGAAEVVDARQLPYWRDPALPEGWVFDWAGSGGLADPAYGYCARYLGELRPSPLDGGELRRFPALDLCGYHADVRLYPEDAAWRNGASIFETRTIAGRPARVIYSPPGPNHDHVPGVSLWIYDAETDSEYFLIGVDSALRGDNVGPMIAIARSLFEGE